MELIKFTDDKKYVKAFCDLPKRLYTSKDNMEDPGSMKNILLGEHPLSKYFTLDKFLVYDGSEAVGRFAITTYDNDDTAYLGFYECIDSDDEGIAHLRLLHENHLTHMRSNAELLLSVALVIDTERRAISKNGEELDVRDKEYEVLLYLAKNRGRIVELDELYKMVWNELPLASSRNTITVHILNLRRKLEDDASSPRVIRTVWGKGYQID